MSDISNFCQGCDYENVTSIDCNIVMKRVAKGRSECHFYTIEGQRLDKAKLYFLTFEKKEYSRLLVPAMEDLRKAIHEAKAREPEQ